MTNEFVLALFIMAVGLSAAGALTHLYQAVWRVPAEITYTGSTYIASLGNLFISFVCGPYLLLRLGLQPYEGEQRSALNILLASLIAFGWSFITGLFMMAFYLAVFSG